MSNVGVSVGRHPFWIWQMLMIAARVVGGLVHPPTIEEMERELTKVIEDFDRAVNVEALRLAKETGKHSISQPGDRSCSIILYRARPCAWAAQVCRGRL
jgi:hypothetical protein